MIIICVVICDNLSSRDYSDTEERDSYAGY